MSGLTILRPQAAILRKEVKCMADKPDCEKGEKGTDRNKEGIAYGMLGIVLNFFLFGAKYFAGAITDSIAIIADAFNNLSDAGSSFITMVGFYLAGKKPDSDHPYGHARYEYISGFVVSLAIILMGIELARSSIVKILHPVKPDTDTVAIVILIISIIVKAVMAGYNYFVGKRINSAAMKATATDSISDMITTSAALLSILIIKHFGYNVDGYAGLLVAGFILFAGFMAVKDTLDLLLGKTPSKEYLDKLESIVMSYDMVLGVHDIMVHDYGPDRVMVSLHAEVPGEESVFVIHDVIDAIERRLKDELGCDVTIHMDPVQINDEAVMELRVRIENAIKNIDSRITLHDFRVVTCDTHKNVIFDVVVPYKFKSDDASIMRMIEEEVYNIDGTLIPVITIDKSYVK